MLTILAPNTAHNGISAGVRFTAGVGQTDNPAALAYFARAGYTVALAAPAPAEMAAPVLSPEPVPAAPRAPARPKRR